MSNFNKFSAVALIALMQVSVVSAADFNSCTVEEVVMGAVPENGHVRLSCVIAPRPACATANAWIGFDKLSPKGKDYMSMALTAFSTNAKLTGFVDNNLCSPHQPNVAWLTGLRMTR